MIARGLLRGAWALVRFGFRPLLVVAVVWGVASALVSQESAATAVVVVLAGAGVLEGALWRRGAEGKTRARLRRWGCWSRTLAGVVHAAREATARKRGNRLLRSVGWLKEDEHSDSVRVYLAAAGREASARIPALDGLTAEKVQKVMEAEAWKYGAETVRVEGVRALGAFMVWFQRPRHLPARVDYPANVRATLAGVPMGVDETGEVVTVALEQASLLIGGVPGGGKSMAVSTLIAGAASVDNVEIWGLDPKRGVELAPWRRLFHEFASEPDEFGPMLDRLSDEMDRRYRLLSETGARSVKIGPDMPLLLVIVDELAEITATGDRKTDAALAGQIRHIAQLGRAAGITLVLATQRPSAEIVPTALRDLMLQRIAFATSTREMSVMILGDGQRGEGPGPESISVSERGTGYIIGAGDAEARRYKGYFLADERIPGIVDGVIGRAVLN